MKKICILLLASVSLIFSSCIKDTDSTTSDDYCYISSVTLGTLKRVAHTLNSSGQDSTYITSYSGSSFLMTIDQKNEVIENRDSLLYGTKLNAVLVTISYDGSVVAYRAAGSQDSWTAYSSSDSIDLSKPLELYTLANDGNSYRVYTLRVNVHQQEGDSLYWHKTDSTVAELNGMTSMQAVILNDKLSVLCSNTSGIQLATRSGLSATETWTLASTNLPATTDVQTLKQHGNTLYVSTTDGQLYSSTDGTSWQALGTPQDGAQLIGITDNYFYALINSGIYKSTDATAWEKDSLDSDNTYLPSNDIKTLQFTQENDNERLVMIGYKDKASGNSAIVWNKMWNTGCPEEKAEWVYFNQTAENKQRCPNLEYLNVIKYDNRCMAFGGASADGSHKAMDKLYISNDYGISWRQDLELHLPADAKGVSGPITSTVDSNNVIWIVANNQVWCGRLNRLGFLRQ